MEKHFIFKLQQEDFNLADEHQKIRSLTKNTGAIVTFTGLVRELLDDQTRLEKLELSTYAALVENQLKNLKHHIEENFTIDHMTIIHRYGQLKPHEQIVFVGTASQHRNQAFMATQMAMDFLKSQIAFWKKEIYQSGSDKTKHRWIEPTEQDYQSFKQW